MQHSPPKLTPTLGTHSQGNVQASQNNILQVGGTNSKYSYFNLNKCYVLHIDKVNGEVRAGDLYKFTEWSKISRQYSRTADSINTVYGFTNQNITLRKLNT